MLVWRKLLKRSPSYWAELPIGLLIWRVLTLIPGVKVAAGLVVVPLGLGVLARLLGKKKASSVPALPEISADRSVNYNKRKGRSLQERNPKN